MDAADADGHTQQITQERDDAAIGAVADQRQPDDYLAQPGLGDRQFEPNRVVEWQHPLGHRWRWEFVPVTADLTTVTETFDYSRVSGLKARGLELTGTPKKNAAGIEATLRQLQDRYPAT